MILLNTILYLKKQNVDINYCNCIINIYNSTNYNVNQSLYDDFTHLMTVSEFVNNEKTHQILKQVYNYIFNIN